MLQKQNNQKLNKIIKQLQMLKQIVLLIYHVTYKCWMMYICGNWGLYSQYASRIII